MIVGGRLINRAVLNEASTRIRLDLNAAREIYGDVQKRMELAFQLVGAEDNFQAAIESRQLSEISVRLEDVMQRLSLDFGGLVGPRGTNLYRLARGLPDDPEAQLNPLVQLALERGTLVSGTMILDREALLAEDPLLADRARIELIPTKKATPRSETEETSGMVVACAIPIRDGSSVSYAQPQKGIIGVLYGGILLNRNIQTVDRIRDTVFQQESYGGRSVGTATIFFQDLRISTNVMTAGGNRAVGTRVSGEVRDRVLIEGERWTDRAFVVDDWYITAYEPIVDVFDNRVGMLYVGVLEARYVDIRRQTLLVFVLITAIGIVLSFVLGTLLGQRILKPVQQLIAMSRKVSGGDLSPELGTISRNEIGVLQSTFQEMLSSLWERDQRQKADSEKRLVQSEKQAAIGRLAAGLAHEINNPLTGVLTFTHMLLRRQDIGDEIRDDLQSIAQSTERVRSIVKGLLDFSRQTRIDPELTDINSLIRDTVKLVANEARVKGVQLRFDPGQGVPLITLDRGQIESVLLNMIMNALDAIDNGGRVDLVSRLGSSDDGGQPKDIEIAISDTGCGIPSQNMDKLFDPFFTTKDVGKGTGLGLAVSWGIVERHGGTIQVDSTVGEGTTFTIRLPVAEVQT